MNVRRPRNDERRCEKCVFCYRFGRPATTIYETVARRSSKPQFWTSDDHHMMKGMLGRASKGSFCHTFGHPTTTNDEVNDEGCLPCSPAEPTRTQKKRVEILEKRTLFDGQPFSASSPASLSQQPLSAPFSAAILSSHPHQPFSATFLSSLYQPPC